MSAEAQLDDVSPAGLAVSAATEADRPDRAAPAGRLRESRRLRARAAAGTAGRYLVALLACAAYLVPLLFVANTSLKSQGQFLGAPESLVSHPHWTNYLDAWRQAAFSSLVGNSLLYALVAATAATGLSLFLAFPIARGYVRGADWWQRLFVISLFLPLALTTQFQLMLSLHLVNTQIGYIILMTSSFGVGPFLITSYLRSLPRELDQAAAIDGVGYFRYVVRVVLPLSKPVVITAFIFQLISVWNDIVNATIYLQNPSYLPVTKGLQNFVGQYSGNVPLLASAILIVALPLLLAYVFAQRFFVAGALGGAFKG